MTHSIRHALITGANGFIARALVARLHRLGVPQLTLIDTAFDTAAPGGARQIIGSIADDAILSQAFVPSVDVVFHLASVPGGRAEQQFQLGLQVNLAATVAILEHMRKLHEGAAAGPPPKLVFASSIAVYGAPLPEVVDEWTPAHPTMSYGAHKLIGEVLATDYDRRGSISACSLRLPGIVARPPQVTGHASAFMSDLIRQLAAGRPYHCPVPPHSTLWLESVACVVDNLLHATTLTKAQTGSRRVWSLPALRTSVAQLAAAVGTEFKVDVAPLITYGHDAQLERSFGRHPPLLTPTALNAGFSNDGDLTTLVRRALEPQE